MIEEALPSVPLSILSSVGEWAGVRVRVRARARVQVRVRARIRVCIFAKDMYSTVCTQPHHLSILVALRIRMS